MRALLPSILLTVLACVTRQAMAQPDYRCRVERVNGAAGENDPVILQERKAYVGKEFAVERTTGVMTGALKNAYVTKPQVIDRGSNDNAFKAVTTMRVDQGVGRGSTLFALVLNEFLESPKKTFAFMSRDTVYFGTCTHFQ
jgi:hypothetical protein